MFGFSVYTVSKMSTIIPVDFARFMGIYLFWSFAHVAASNYYTIKIKLINKIFEEN